MLTVAALKSATPGSVLWDDDVPGLHARVYAATATYSLFYRTRSGRQRRMKVGRVGVLTLPQARSLARSALLKIAEGQDPAGDTAFLRESPTFAEGAELYMAKHAVNKKASSRAKDRQMLDAYLLPRWGARKVAEITDDDVAALRDEMVSTPYQFNRVLALLSMMMNLFEAPRWRLRATGTNPTKGIHRFPEKPRRRYMKKDEAVAIAQLLDAAEPGNPESVAFIRLCILVGARPGEIASGRRKWLERHPDGSATLHHPEVKTGERDIFFSPAAVAIVDGVPAPDDGSLVGIQSPQKLWVRIRRDAGCPDLQLRDLRRSFASVALSLGYSLAQIGELLGHTQASTTKRYAYLIEEHKQAAATATATAIVQRMGV